MAELTSPESAPVSVPPIPASAQLLAVAWLRWRIFVNGMFRKRPRGKGQVVGLVFGILLRLIVWPMLALVVIGPVAISGFFAWMAISQGHPQRLASLLLGIALLWQFVSINGLSIAATIPNFDPASLVRFPLRFGRYFVLRSLLGLMTPSTIVGCLASVGRRGGHRRSQHVAGAACTGGLGGLRVDEHLSHAHDRRVDGALAGESPLP